MGHTKKFTGLKLNTSGFANPQNGTTPLASLGNAAVAYTSAVPCRGARMIAFTIKGAGAGALASQTSYGGNVATMLDAVTGSGADFIIQGDGGFSISVGGGLVVIVKPANLPVFGHAFVSIGFTNDTTTKTNVTVDAEVFYEGEGDMEAAAYGQGAETIL